MTDRYPPAMSGIPDWARRNGVTVAEARRRYAQYVTLCGIVAVPALRASLVFKGGNALDFVWQPNRSTLDLDFSLDMVGATFEANVESIRDLLQRGLRGASARFGIAFAINSVRQQPPGPDRDFITYTARVGYGLPDEHQILVRMANGQGSPHMLPIEISINEPIGDSTEIAIGNEVPRLRVCTLEDIVGEKLRSLLQQPIRNRYRSQDVLDIAVIVTNQPRLDRVLVAQFLIRKAAARNVPVSREAFRNPDVADRARLDYAALEPTTRLSFIPFDEAFARVLALVDELSIPDQ